MRTLNSTIGQAVIPDRFVDVGPGTPETRGVFHNFDFAGAFRRLNDTAYTLDPFERASLVFTLEPEAFESAVEKGAGDSKLCEFGNTCK